MGEGLYDGYEGMFYPIPSRLFIVRSIIGL
jgi:hypothetical protein